MGRKAIRLREGDRERLLKMESMRLSWREIDRLSHLCPKKKKDEVLL
jgi:hypothetical protein